MGRKGRLTRALTNSYHRNLVYPDLAERVVDATGHIVTPGFVDIHTHYDGQVTWDPLLTPSSGHGNFDFIFDHCALLKAPKPHIARAVCYVLLGTHADRVTIGAWNPML